MLEERLSLYVLRCYFLGSFDHDDRSKVPPTLCWTKRILYWKNDVDLRFYGVILFGNFDNDAGSNVPLTLCRNYYANFILDEWLVIYDFTLLFALATFDNADHSKVPLCSVFITLFWSYIYEANLRPKEWLLIYVLALCH